MKGFLFFLLIFPLLSQALPQETEVSFLLKDHILIPMKIGGKEYSFVFDTGSTSSIVSEEFVKAMGLQTSDSIQGIFLAKRSAEKRPLYDTANFEIGDLSVKSRFSSIPDIPTNIIGMDIISQLHWQFDFRTSKVRISKQEIPLTGSDSIRMTMEYCEPSNLMLVLMKLDGSLMYYVHLDTGMPFHPMQEDFVSFATKYPASLEKRLLKNTQVTPAFFNINMHFRLMILPSITINDVKFKYPAFLFDMDPKNIYFQGVFIGLPFIVGRFQVFNINPKKREITLARPNGTEAEHEQLQRKKYEKLMAEPEGDDKEIDLRESMLKERASDIGIFLQGREMPKRNLPTSTPSGRPLNTR